MRIGESCETLKITNKKNKNVMIHLLFFRVNYKKILSFITFMHKLILLFISAKLNLDILINVQMCIFFTLNGSYLDAK